MNKILYVQKYVGYFFQVPIGRDIKTTGKSEILHLQHLATPTSYFSTKSTLDVEIFRSVVATFRHRSQPSVLSANSLRWSAAHCAKMLSSYDHFIRQRYENHREPSPGG